MLQRLEHGGRLAVIAEQTQRPLAQWLDLSTGISPWPWPVPAIPESVWQQLPNDDDHLEAIAQGYYRSATRPLAVPGSQWLIRQLPRMVKNKGAVALPCWGYQEHALAWQSQGFESIFYRDESELLSLVENEDTGISYAVVINPNNPSGDKFSPELLDRVALGLSQRQGLLVVDEAFSDSRPGDSMLTRARVGQVAVLRSVGKFFGLAGIRLGFGFLPEKLHQQLALECQPWAVSHPSRYLGALCLQDSQWQQAQSRRLQSASTALQKQLQKLARPLGISDYFISLMAEEEFTADLHQFLLDRAIYVRRFEPQLGQAMLRFGLCKDDELPRLAQAINEFLKQHVMK